MKPILLYTGTASGVQTAVFLPNIQNITGHVQVVGSGTVTIEGSVDGVNFVTIVSAVTAANGYHIAIFPFMRANITSASGTTSVFIVVA